MSLQNIFAKNNKLGKPKKKKHDVFFYLFNQSKNSNYIYPGSFCVYKERFHGMTYTVTTDTSQRARNVVSTLRNG